MKIMKMNNIVPACAFGLCVLFASGCAHDRFLNADQTAVVTPQPPPILATPAVYLLTNNAGFLANVRIEEQRGASSGRLYGSGTHLFYAPDEKSHATKHGPTGGFSFIWDAAKNSGIVICEALQGYAPISHSGNGSITNVTVELGLVTATLRDGSQIKFQSASKTGKAGIPERVTGGTPAFNAVFEKVQSEVPPPEVFKVPDGLTAYQSMEAMVDEMAFRYRNLKRRSD